ncbi:MAG TPA: CDGSH iron-sulfur domain-containing protein [Afifellaceae bacterium]|nr:CDGSH iron-sulfur domain-containing protein [Afifellaceae bacterium]
MARSQTYEGRGLRVHFNPGRCIHARQCVLGLPGVFRPAERAWIHPDEADPEDLAAVIKTCPSGALTYERVDAGTPERPPQVNRARLWEHGPVEIRGDLKIGGEDTGTRAVLCRCGRSKNKPWCDNSHRDMGFKATGEPKAAEHPAEPAERGGQLALTPLKDGPMQVVGNLEIVSGSGRRLECSTETYFCRCGGSAKKPFCDGTHARIGFQAEGE